jgi:chromosome segregation ATPase
MAEPFTHAKENLNPAAYHSPSKPSSYAFDTTPMLASRQCSALDCIMGAVPTPKTISTVSFIAPAEVYAEKPVATNSQMKTEVKAILEQLDAMKSKLTTEAIIKETLQTDLARSKDTCAVLLRDKAELERRVEALKAEKAELSDEGSKSKYSAAKLKTAIQDLEQTKDNLDASLEKIKLDYSNQYSEYSLLQSRYESLKTDHKRLKGEAKQYSDTLHELESMAEQANRVQTDELAKLEKARLCLEKENGVMKETLERNREAHVRETELLRRRHEEDMKLQLNEFTYKHKEALIELEFEKKKIQSEKETADKLLATAQAEREEAEKAGLFLATQSSHLAAEKDDILTATSAQRAESARFSLLMCALCFAVGVLSVFFGSRVF